MASDESWFSDDAVELAIEVERELGLAEGATVVWRKSLYRRIPGGWVEVHDAELSRRVADYAGRETPKGPLYLTAAKVRGAVAMVKMRWPAVRELPAVKEASVAMFEKYLRAGPEEAPHGS